LQALFIFGAGVQLGSSHSRGSPDADLARLESTTGAASLWAAESRGVRPPRCTRRVWPLTTQSGHCARCSDAGRDGDWWIQAATLAL